MENEHSEPGHLKSGGVENEKNKDFLKLKNINNFNNLNNLKNSNNFNNLKNSNNKYTNIQITQIISHTIS